jgi:hypothetical protein
MEYTFPPMIIRPTHKAHHQDHHKKNNDPTPS